MNIFMKYFWGLYGENYEVIHDDIYQKKGLFWRPYIVLSVIYAVVGTCVLAFSFGIREMSLLLPALENISTVVSNFVFCLVIFIFGLAIRLISGFTEGLVDFFLLRINKCPVRYTEVVNLNIFTWGITMLLTIIKDLPVLGTSSTFIAIFVACWGKFKYFIGKYDISLSRLIITYVIYYIVATIIIIVMMLQILRLFI